MKIVFLLFVISMASSCSSQSFELERIINENAQIIEFEENEYSSILNIILEDSILIYKSPMASLVGKKYTKNRNQYVMMPIENLHPKGIFFDIDKRLVKIYPRENKPGFFDNISSNNKLRWKIGEFDSDVCSIRMNKDFDSKDFKDLRTIFERFVKANNLKLNKNENPPKEGVKRPKYKNYRNRIMNLTSKLESTDFVLPIHKVTTKPTIRELNFQESLAEFENQMKRTLAKKQVEIEANLRGFILIDIDGNIIEVLQEESNSTYTKINNSFEQLAMNYKGWKPAEFKNKTVICKLKYYIQKRDWD